MQPGCSGSLKAFDCIFGVSLLYICLELWLKIGWDSVPNVSDSRVSEGSVKIKPFCLYRGGPSRSLWSLPNCWYRGHLLVLAHRSYLGQKATVLISRWSFLSWMANNTSPGCPTLIKVAMMVGAREQPLSFLFAFCPYECLKPARWTRPSWHLGLFLHPYETHGRHNASSPATAMYRWPPYRWISDCWGWFDFGGQKIVQTFCWLKPFSSLMNS